MKKRFLTMLVLLVAVVSGAWAQDPAKYKITVAEGTEDAGNWIVPEEAAEGSPVTVTYSGERKVKSVKAVKKASGPGVTTFSELQAALSAGKDVKLMNDIVCTAGIEITSNEPLTIDGNGKTLSTTSEIRAFKVGASATVAFKNLTLTGFVNEGGPAINNSGTIVLDGCTISNCHVSNGDGGGAIENKSSGKLYAINTTFSGNYSGEIGGAINNYRGSLYMSGCTFTNNYTTQSDAYYGGAIGINSGSEIRLINCSFSGNKYGTNTGNNDIGVYSKPTNDNYTIAGCTGATIASAAGDITTIASGTATLDYSDLSNISFTVEQAAKTPATVTTAPTGAAIVGVGKTTALVSGGAAEGGTMMYKVTTENTMPASTDGFSDAVPTAQTITASGKVYVWYYVKGDDTHSDSEIAATAIEVTVMAVPITVTWNPSDIVPKSLSDESFTKDGITFTAATCDFQVLTFGGGGTFTNTIGNFTKIEISADFAGDVSGTGWSNDGWQSATWTGNAASVSFSGDIWGGGMTCEGGNLTIVFTIE